MGRFPAACDHSIGPSRTLSVPSPPHSHSPSALLGAEVARDADGTGARGVVGRWARRDFRCGGRAARGQAAAADIAPSRDAYWPAAGGSEHLLTPTATTRSGRREVRVGPCSTSTLVRPAGPPRGGDGEGMDGPITGQEVRQPAREGDRRQFAADGTVPARNHARSIHVHVSAACV